MKKASRFKYLVYIYVLGIVYFTLFRIAETLVFRTTEETVEPMGGLYWEALYIGWRFDTLVSCFILALPAIMMIIGELFRISKRGYYTVPHWFINIAYTICFFACAADIPYFCYFFSRLDVMALSWGDSFSVVVDMIVSEPMYIGFLLIFIAVAVSWWLLTRLIFRRVLVPGLDLHLSYPYSIPLVALLAFGIFVGMRGRLSKKSPIHVDTASFCSNAFLNQIGLNPVYTFMKSVEENAKSDKTEENLIDAATAQAVLADLRQLQQAPPSTLLPQGMNVVLVLMESMTVEKTSLGANPQASLTPNLDSLMQRGLSFSRLYSAGIHTYNGIYSTLYSHPAILSRHTMKHAKILQMCGLPQVLAANGYSTAYFMPHDEDFDNMRAFLYNNGFEKVIGQHSYPSSEVIGTWGIPDHLLFDHALQHCNQQQATGPFFTCIMTCSDHTPYSLPDDIDFHPHNSELSKKMVEYADWSIGRFMSEAAHQSWFENTVFVFVADHGASSRHLYDMSIPHNHIPLVIYAPRYIQPQIFDRLALQIDIAPTLLSMLGIDFDNNTLGIDFMSAQRPYAYFCADDRVGVMGEKYLYIYRSKQQRASLYDYSSLSTTDIIDLLPDTAAAMSRYAFGMIESSRELVAKGKTRCAAAETNLDENR